MQQDDNYLSIKTGQTSKTSAKASGMIGYRILSNADKTELFIRIESNEGGGYFSKEFLPFGKIEACLIGFVQNASLPAKTFRPAFVGKSSNNAGFLCSILRTEGLMTHDPAVGYSHRVSCDWKKWKSDTLGLPATPFSITPPASNVTELKVKETISAGESDDVGATGKRKQRKEHAKREHPTGHEAGSES